MHQRRDIILIVLLAGTVSLAAAKEYRYPFQKIIDVGPRLQMTVSNVVGDIQVKPSGEDKLIVEAVKRVEAEDQTEADRIADRIQIDIVATEGHYTIEPRLQKGDESPRTFWEKLLGKSGGPSRGAVDFVISVPTGCGANITCQSGRIDVEGLQGDITANTASGAVTVRGIVGAVDVTASSGDVKVEESEGPIQISAVSGTVGLASLRGEIDVRHNAGRTTGEYLTGNIIMLAVTGSIELNHVEGDVRIKGGSGAITVLQDSGALNLATESGNISVRTDLKSESDFQIDAGSGTIEFAVPEGASGRIRMETGSGRIDTSMPVTIDSFAKNRIVGNFGDGGPKITLTTLSGDIRLSQF